MATIVNAAPTPVAHANHVHPFDAALAGGFCVLALASLIGLPRALARIPGGADRFQVLLSAGLIALLACAALTILWPRLAAFLPRRHTRTLPNLTIALCGLIGLMVMLVAIYEFRGWPQFADSFAEMFQARLLSVGKFTTAAPERQDLLRIGNTVIDHGRWYSQYPIGNPALLALGIVLKMPWLPGLIVGVLFAAGTMAIATIVGGVTLATITGALMLVSPMVLLSSAAVLSNATFAALGAVALALVLKRRATAPQLALAGALTGLGACVRPLDALVLALSLGVYLLLRPASRTTRRVAVPMLMLGTLLGGLPLLFANAQTTGSAFRLGYTVLWGDGNLPGFGTRGPGIPFGPADAAQNLLFDTSLLNVSLLAWPVPVLVVAAVAVGTRVRTFDPRWRLLLGYALAHVLVYFFYWHHDFFFGPRFLLPIAPVLFVILADALRRIVRWHAARVPERAVLFGRLFLPVQALVAAALVALPSLMHAASPSVANAAAIARAARSADLGTALVFVNDGWGSRLFGEMWLLGMSARTAEQLYGRVDACTLQRALDAANSLTGVAAERAVLAATAQASRGVPMGRGVEPTLRLPGPNRNRREASEPAGNTIPVSLPEECAAQLAFDEESYRSPFAPLLWRNDPNGRGTMFMRDPGPVSLLQASLPVYRVVVASSNGTYVVRFSALDDGAIKEVRFAH